MMVSTMDRLQIERSGFKLMAGFIELCCNWARHFNNIVKHLLVKTIWLIQFTSK